jgi:hypothetical protein
MTVFGLHGLEAVATETELEFAVSFSTVQQYQTAYKTSFRRAISSRTSHYSTMSVGVILHVYSEIRAVVDCLDIGLQALPAAFVCRSGCQSLPIGENDALEQECITCKMILGSKINLISAFFECLSTQ